MSKKVKLMASDILYLGIAYTALIGLIGWFSFQLFTRLQNVSKRLEAIESTINKKSEK
tara:strand:- start:476 stop:649 length:174 start_codon:yes stop_codon:yes gene_type:complete